MLAIHGQAMVVSVRGSIVSLVTLGLVTLALMVPRSRRPSPAGERRTADPAWAAVPEAIDPGDPYPLGLLLSARPVSRP